MSDSKKWKYRPNSINIETVQGCNRRCHFCGTMGMEKKIHLASIKTITHTANLIKGANLNCQIRLAGHGEPTLHPDLPKIIKILRATLPTTPISMFTNGTVIERKPELIDVYFSCGLNNLIVDEYSDHLVGQFIETDQTCAKYNIVRQGSGTPMFNKDYKSKRICIMPPIDMDGNTINRKLCNHMGAGLPPLKIALQKKCSVIFRELTVRWDGKIAICCNDFRGYYPVTNINDCVLFEHAWFHPRFESARKYLILGDRSFFPCNVCDVLPNRPAFLPDWKGKVVLDKPSATDREIVTKRYEPCSVIEKREWEI